MIKKKFSFLKLSQFGLKEIWKWECNLYHIKNINKYCINKNNKKICN